MLSFISSIALLILCGDRPTLSDVWAKLKYKDDDRSTGVITSWHPLVAHSADVAAVLEALLTTHDLAEATRPTDAGWDVSVRSAHRSAVQRWRRCTTPVRPIRAFRTARLANMPWDDHVTPIVGMLSERYVKPVSSSVLGLVATCYSWFGR